MVRLPIVAHLLIICEIKAQHVHENSTFQRYYRWLSICFPAGGLVRRVVKRAIAHHRTAAG